MITLRSIPLKFGYFFCVQAADRSSSGLLEFEDVGDALIALMLCNHAPIQNPGKCYNYIEPFDIFIVHNEYAFYVP
jgi:hypothetical protein